MSRRLVIQRPWAYMWRPARGILVRTVSRRSPFPRTLEPLSAVARTTCASNERSPHAIASPPTRPSFPLILLLLSASLLCGLPEGRVLTNRAASGRGSTRRARTAPTPGRSRSRAPAVASTGSRVCSPPLSRRRAILIAPIWLAIDARTRSRASNALVARSSPSLASCRRGAARRSGWRVAGSA